MSHAELAQLFQWQQCFFLKNLIMLLSTMFGYVSNCFENRNKTLLKNAHEEDPIFSFFSQNHFFESAL